MAILRWRQPRDIFAVQDEMNRLFDNMLGTYGREEEQRQLLPPSDITESKDGYLVAVELPGLKKEEVKITLHDHSLTISGEKKRETESKDDTYHRIERSFGMFSRTYELPGVIDSSKIKAEFKDGVLSVQLPKVEAAKPKEIPIMVK